jgi:Spy/CpxP family protein refolding chaperone
MKKIFLGLVTIITITLSANAQVQREQSDNVQDHQMGDHGKSGRGHGGHMDGMMMKDLNLSDAQKQQMSSINTDFRNKMQELNKHDNLSVKDFRAQKEALESDRKAKFDAILTAEQKNKFTSLKKDHEANDNMSDGRGGNMSEGRHGNNMEKMQSELGLTTDQVSRMKADRESFKVKAEAIKNNSSLSEDQKKEQFMQLRKDREQNLKSYLNSDQIKKLDEMKSKRWDDAKNKRSMKTT